jgi:hypothetical protein
MCTEIFFFCSSKKIFTFWRNNYCLGGLDYEIESKYLDNNNYL